MSTETQSADTDTEDEGVPHTGSTTFIETSGGILTEQLVTKLRQRRCAEEAVDPKTFTLPEEEPKTESEIEDEIANSWDKLRERWDELTMTNELFGMDVSEARQKWILKLFEELGFEPDYQRQNLEVGGVEANLSHKGWPDEGLEGYEGLGEKTAPILHAVEPSQELDESEERGSKSPHDLLQNFLNASQDNLWSVVTNGLSLRILRDYYHTYTRGYVEFDLESMFMNRNYGDFRALYRLCHASRFVTSEEDEEDKEIPLERLYQVALSTGVKIGQDLQSNVVEAIETLGNGFLDADIREELEEVGEEAEEEYYQDILYVVYRVLFLMFAEQRGMMSERNSLYMKEYSVTKLRERSERREGTDRNTDLWEGLKATFTLVGEGNDELDIPAYNGGLFDDEKLEYVIDADCPNDKLLNAIDELTHIEKEGYRQRISYADLGVEEIGAVYESLLEFTPRVAQDPVTLEDKEVSRGEFYLDDRGLDRKETGSYYTDKKLVQELIDSALKPVVEDRLESADDTKKAKEEALLDIKVCDPACGSAAFLIAATNYMGKKLAEVRSETEYPADEEVRRAKRSALQHCIYGVDLNPMAVELAKVSLWIDSAVEDKPLNFLDHHIKCGNSLIGTTRDLVSEGLPQDAYDTSGGRDWHPGNELRKRVRNENKKVSKGSDSSSLADFDLDTGLEEQADLAEKINDLEEESAADIREKEEMYRDLLEDEDFQREKHAFDVWTAAFFWDMRENSIEECPTPKKVEKIRKGNLSDDLRVMIEEAEEIAEDVGFFHWELEYPEVFAEGGFDCVLGNPPWERVKFQEEEFFATRDQEIADASTKSERQELIQQLEEDNPELYKEYQDELSASQNTSRFLRESGRYELTAKGDINYYPLFAGLARDSINPRGRVGMVVPSGIATDYYTQDFFRDLVKNKQLTSLYDFENSEGIFSGLHRSYKFSLLTLTGEDFPTKEADFAFYLTEVEQLRHEERHFSLTEEDLRKINPNTGSCPIFRSQRDAEVAQQLYDRTPVLINERTEENPWGVGISRIIDLNGDSELLFSADDLESIGAISKGSLNYLDDEKRWLRVYEGKMINIYNHRSAATYTVEGSQRSGRSTETEVEELHDPEYLVDTRFWVEEEDIEKKNGDWNRDWYFSYMDVCAATNKRTMIAAIIPESAPSFSLRVLTECSADAPYICCLLGNYNSFSYDFAARQSVGGVHLSDHVVKQLPVIPPQRYTDEIIQFVVPRVLELSYTAWDLAPFADDVWSEASGEVQAAIEQQWESNAEARNDGEPEEPQWVTHSEVNDEYFPYPPFNWDAERRDEIRAQLDALFACLYGLDRNDLDYLLDTFPVVEKEDRKEHGEFRTKRLILEYFDKFEGKYTTKIEEDG